MNLDTLSSTVESQHKQEPISAPVSGMDRRIEKKKWPPRRIAMYAGLAIGVPFLAYQLLIKENVTRLNVATERLTIATVERAPFQEFIPVIGTIEPLRTVYLDAVTGGRIVERYLEAGSMVNIGDPILKLDNFNLQLSVSSQETQLLEQMNNLHNTA